MAHNVSIHTIRQSLRVIGIQKWREAGGPVLSEKDVARRLA